MNQFARLPLETNSKQLMKTILAATLAIFSMALPRQAQAQFTVDDLTQAAGEGNQNRVIAILDSGVDLNAKDSKGWYPISKAAAHGQTRIIALLTTRRANINVMTTRRNTPLLFAASRGHESAVRFLLNAGANSFIANVDRELPESIARQKGYPQIADLIHEFQRR